MRNPRIFFALSMVKFCSRLNFPIRPTVTKLTSKRMLALNECYALEETAAVGPVIGSFSDVWEARQDSDVLLDGTCDREKKSCNPPQVYEGVAAGAAIVAFCHNPYSLTHPVVECIISSASSAQGAFSHIINAHEADRTISPPTATTTSAGEVVDASSPSYVASRFMPPPPPSIATREMLLRDSNSSRGAELFVYNLVTRWYARVLVTQHQFIQDPSCLCPAPDPSQFSFEEWMDLVNKWWQWNFAHLQKKQQTFHHRSNLRHRTAW